MPGMLQQALVDVHEVAYVCLASHDFCFADCDQALGRFTMESLARRSVMLTLHRFMFFLCNQTGYTGRQRLLVYLQKQYSHHSSQSSFCMQYNVAVREG